MELIKEKQELAMAMNFGKYPVLKIDLADADDYGLKGCKVRIDAGNFPSGEPWFIKAELRVYRDDCKLTTSAAPVGLSANFTHTDYFKMAEYATAPIIKPDQEVVVAIYDSKKAQAYAAVKVRTQKFVSRHCSTPIDFVDADMTPFLWCAGIAPEKKN